MSRGSFSPTLAGSQLLAATVSEGEIPAPLPEPTGAGRRLVAEWEPHTRTFMSWPAREDVWAGYLDDVRWNIAELARAIAYYEPVVMLARPEQADAAQRACGSGVQTVELAVDDLWARDTVPVFVRESAGVVGVDLNFNGWGGKQPHDDDARLGRELLSRCRIPRVRAPFVGEGGALETDGAGTLLVTASSLVNENRNPGSSRETLTTELRETLGVEQVVWFDGVAGEDVTDAHVDCLARFAAPGIVLLDTAFPDAPADSWSRSAEQARAVLAAATDARGRGFEVVELPQPDPDVITGEGAEFVASYTNFYIGNGAVFVPRFGDRRADDRAQGILREHFADREIVPVSIDEIAAGGGGIHCATHDQPA
ncbi:agmatine deiminase family protein [Nocardia sp. NPDC127579]|uniref:agmatine deiminase family protein n=1 Tax=Nocardia sp. NPDC127579 TaxID=3345402 RepID=UPI003629C39F